ncbi:MAG: hypothetical protein BRD55_02835 [Bacteroidetes bacterium SW_9_63_38]|nr:MAG: hypothetical protein BRD55_02835 [Bacteroidetes bacterium SW_9_63_38]
MPPSSIATLRDALSSPSAYPHCHDAVTLQQTHISIVALVPPWVYKVKKPVELDFLDFSTLEKRHAYCKQEVALNTRLCGDTYEGVVPVVQTDDGIRVDPNEDEGDIVDYAVKMHYLPPEHFLDAQLDRGDAGADAIDRVAQTLCRFYKAQSTSAEIAESGWVDRLRDGMMSNFEQTTDHVGTFLSRPACEALRYYTDRFFDQNAALLHRRRAGGLIVDGHGDLRLEHVHLTDDHVCIYDCIEFNDELRHLDIANDIAFLAMDLDLHGRPALGRRLVSQVAETMGDPEIDRLIDFYKCSRTHVRGKVEGIRARAEEVPPQERLESRMRAQRHYQWGLRYAVAGTGPFVIVMFGRSGTGKSTQASALAEALGWAHLASDRIRKTLAGVPLHQRTDAAERTDLYSDRMSDRTYRTLQRRAVERGRNLQGTVLDATYSDPDRRDTLRTALRSADIPYAFVELTAPDDVLRERLATRDAASATASDARADDFEMLNDRYQVPTALEDPFHVRVSAADAPADTTLNILKALIRLNG